MGDVGLLLGLCLLLLSYNTTDYDQVFQLRNIIAQDQITILEHRLMRSAQFAYYYLLERWQNLLRYHYNSGYLILWKGPTPISALIHAATMVTAGIYMVARLSPMYELTEDVLLFILYVGSITAFFLGLVALVQNDIKRIIAYSTISQLGYMTAALGASLYSLAMFHLNITHAFFKALLFLCAGSIIIKCHHEQDIRKIGGLRQFMPLTYLAFLYASLSLIGFPLTSGFYSKESIIDAIGYLWT